MAKAKCVVKDGEYLNCKGDALDGRLVIRVKGTEPVVLNNDLMESYKIIKNNDPFFGTDVDVLLVYKDGKKSRIKCNMAFVKALEAAMQQ